MSSMLPKLTPPIAKDITNDPNSSISQYYRYYRLGESTGSWLNYTGNEKMAINNATGEVVEYIIEKKRSIFYYGYFISETVSSYVIPIPPTSQPSISNFVINPTSSQSFGSWNISFNLTYSPIWEGTPPIIRLDVECLNGYDVIEKSFSDISLIKDGDTYTGTVTIDEEDVWAWSGTNPGNGYFNAYVIVNSITGTTVPGVSSSYEFTNVWEGIEEAMPSCFVYDQIAMYSWTYSHRISVCPGLPSPNVTTEHTIRWFLNFDSDEWANEESQIRLFDGEDNLIQSWTPDNSESNITISYTITGLSGDITDWYFTLSDTYGDGGISVNWACVTVNEETPSCAQQTCPT